MIARVRIYVVLFCILTHSVNKWILISRSMKLTKTSHKYYENLKKTANIVHNHIQVLIIIIFKDDCSNYLTI